MKGPILKYAGYKVVSREVGEDASWLKVPMLAHILSLRSKQARVLVYQRYALRRA